MFCFIFRAGTENPADDEHRHQIAVEKSTGGSYVVCVQMYKFVLMVYPVLTGLGRIFRQSFHTRMTAVTVPKKNCNLFRCKNGLESNLSRSPNTYRCIFKLQCEDVHRT